MSDLPKPTIIRRAEQEPVVPFSEFRLYQDAVRDLRKQLSESQEIKPNDKVKDFLEDLAYRTPNSYPVSALIQKAKRLINRSE